MAWPGRPSARSDYGGKGGGLVPMRQFLAFVYKEVLYIVRDPRTLLILIVMPVVQVLLFGFALNTEVRGVRLVILDHSQCELSHAITQRFAHNPYFKLQAAVLDHNEFERRMRSGTVDAGLIFPHSFTTDLFTGRAPSLQLIVDASNPNHASIVENYVMAVVYGSLPKGPSVSLPPYSVSIVNRMLFNPSVKSTYNFVPGVMGLVLIIICSIMTSVSIVREKEYGTLDVLRVSPFSPRVLIVAKVVPYAVLSFVNLLSILALSYWVLHVPLRGSLFTLLFISLIYILLGLSVGMCASTFVEKQSNAIIITGIGMIMPTLLLSGMLFPLDSMPRVLQWLSYIVPARWYISAVRQVMIQGVGLISIWREVVMLLGMWWGILGLTLWQLYRKVH